MWEDIHKFITEIEPLLLIIIPAIFATGIKINNKIKEKREELEKENDVKNREKFLEWEHKESMLTTDRIKTVCNYYRDIGNMDLVNYIQFENGTSATSKLCNMFLSCLAEDDRFGSIPKMLPSIQRVPYSRLSTWINNVLSSPDEIYKVTSRSEFTEDYSSFIAGSDEVESFISGSVKDANGVLIGICTFFFNTENYHCEKDNTEAVKHCIETFKSFITSVETVFLSYNDARDKKKEELNLK